MSSDRKSRECMLKLLMSSNNIEKKSQALTETTILPRIVSTNKSKIYLNNILEIELLGTN